MRPSGLTGSYLGYRELPCLRWYAPCNPPSSVRQEEQTEFQFVQYESGQPKVVSCGEEGDDLTARPADQEPAGPATARRLLATFE